MRVFGVFNYGETPSFLGIEEIGETWESIKAAEAALRDRHRDGDWCRNNVTVIDIDDDGTARPGNTDGELFPCVADGASIELFAGTRVRNGWRINRDPFARLTLGPRGGIRRESF